ncbi:MAG TPA: hypothetical protein VIG41_13055 [Micrococcaceae bacterium]
MRQDLTVLRPRFITVLRRVQDENEARERGRPDAGGPGKRDTAPPGAAQPAAHLRDVCAVVVRCFGGVLLGAGGLARVNSCPPGPNLLIDLDRSLSRNTICSASPRTR